MQKEISNFRLKIMELNRKQIPFYILTKIIFTTFLFISIIQINLFFSCKIHSLPYKSYVIFNFKAYQPKSIYFSINITTLFLSSPFIILIYLFFVVNAKKVLEFFFTNFFIFILLCFYENGRIYDFYFFFFWFFFGIIIILISENLCLKFERNRTFTFGGMLDLTKTKDLKPN